MTQEQVGAVERLNGNSIDAVRAIAGRNQEPDWVVRAREDAWATYERLPMPTRRDEGWRRTDISRLPIGAVIPAPEPAALAASVEQLPEIVRDRQRPDDYAAWLVLDNGGPRFLDREQAAASRVTVTDLASALRERADVVAQVLYQHLPANRGKLDALNAAAWTTGAFVHVPRGTALERPLCLTTALLSGPAADFRHAAVIEDGAIATIVDERISDGLDDTTIGNSAVEVNVGAGAQLTYVLLQGFGSAVSSFERVRIVAQRDATVTLVWVVLGGKLTKADYEVALAGPGATARMMGIHLGDASQHADIHTVQHHQAPHTMSDLLYKTALRGRARSIFSGLIRIDHDAREVDAYQLNRNLLLSAKAKADSIPTLEILNNEVKCSHGASVGPVDQEAVYYLMTRGLSQQQAEQMVVEGFFEPIVRYVPQEALQERIRQQITEKVER